jgi:ABC-type oligopeptide transport system ATPase subunit
VRVSIKTSVTLPIDKEISKLTVNAGEIAGIVGESPIDAVIIGTGKTPIGGITARHTNRISGKVPTHACTTSIDKLIELITTALSTEISGGIAALVAKSIDTGLTGES